MAVLVHGSSCSSSGDSSSPWLVTSRWSGPKQRRAPSRVTTSNLPSAATMLEGVPSIGCFQTVLAAALPWGGSMATRVLPQCP